MRRRKPPRFAVGAVVYRYTPAKRLKILLIKKRGGEWTLPKGHVEGDETEIAGLRRELKEEVELSGVVEALLQEVAYDIVKQRRLLPKVVRYYLVQALPGKPRPNRHEQIRRARWFSSSEALQKVTTDRLRDIIERAVVYLRHRD